MKLTELTKDELCELVKRILKSSLSAKYVINEFLIERQNRKFNELMTEFEKTDITKDFAKFKRIMNGLIGCTTTQIIICNWTSRGRNNIDNVDSRTP